MSFEAVVKVFDGVFVRHIFTFEAIQAFRHGATPKQGEVVRNINVRLVLYIA